MKVNKAKKIRMSEGDILSAISDTALRIKRLEVDVQTMARNYTGIRDLEIRGTNGNVDFGTKTDYIKQLNHFNAVEGQLSRLKSGMVNKTIKPEDVLRTPQFYDRIDKIIGNISNKYNAELTKEQEDWLLEQLNGDETYDEIYDYYLKAYQMSFEQEEETEESTPIDAEETIRNLGLIN